VNQEHFFFK